jgi:hypothetical protein
MTLIVEDGTGLATAESYVSVADAGTRHTNLGNTAWTGTDAVKEAALRRATQFMLQRYRGRWQGTRINSTQALDWPRSWVVVDGYAVDADIVPVDVANACADLALKALSETLNADLERGILREKVGPLETEYDAFAPQAKRYPAIDQALAAYLTGGGLSRVVRA